MKTLSEYTRTCRRCGKLFKAKTKYGRICDKCKIPIGTVNNKNGKGVYELLRESGFNIDDKKVKKNPKKE